MSQKIIIIGAGAAGIAAGTKLIKNGFTNMLILEAENRIGGRIWTIPFASNVVDMGAQWCHGEKDNCLYELAAPLNLLSSATTKYDKFNFVFSDGEILDSNIGDRLMDIAIESVECYKEEMSQFRGSLGSFIVDIFQRVLSSEKYKDIKPEIAAKFLDFFHKYENSIEASDTWFDTSAQGYLHYWDCDGDRLLNWKDKGYGTILDIMMEKIPEPSKDLQLEKRICFGKVVKKIEWFRESSIGSVQVVCTDGSTYLADHVISTISLGVLKEQHLSLFEPTLPQKKKNAIQGLTLGTVDKLYLEFSEPFWPKEWQGFSLLWNDLDLVEIRKREDFWIEDIFGFYVVDFQPNILCGWISGVNARRMERTPKEEVLKSIMFLLRKFLKNQNVPDPIRFERTTWFENPNFRGSYTYRSIATDLFETSSADLALPLSGKQGQPVVCFAGEATSDHYYSTVHGAVESGWREAKRIIDFYAERTYLDPKKSLNFLEPKIKDETDVLILGAGLAGLGAAYVLKDSNLRFLVLEAQNRPGGRIESQWMTDSSGNSTDIINAGAQWLHGRLNLLYNISSKHDLLHPTSSEEALGGYFSPDGIQIDEFLLKKVDFEVGKILEDCERNVNKKQSDYPTSVEYFLLKKFDKFLDGLPKEEQITAKHILDFHVRFQIIDNSCLSLNDVSAKSWGTYSFNGESCQAHINFKRSFFDVVAALIQEIGEKFEYGKTVEKIYWGTESLPPESKVFVRCNDGSIYRASSVITTFSLGVLKELELFHPTLPKFYRDLIKVFGFGTINKIYLQFEVSWWKDLKGIQLVFDDELKENSIWTRYLSGFDVLCPGAKNTLLGWVGGQGAIDMEKLSDEEVVRDCVELLRRFTRLKVPHPKAYYVTRWYSNEHIRGAYSYVSCKSDDKNFKPSDLTRFLTYSDLNLPLANGGKFDQPLVVFAGEACHDKYYSTAHGAFESGIEQAKKLLSFVENKKC